jgi:hypothetical protein
LADSVIKYYAVTSDKLNTLDVVDGQLIFVHDARKICLDVNGIRTEYSQIMVLSDEEHRKGLKPIPGFYFVLSTNIFWRYEEDWIPLTLPPREVVVFSDELPQNGVEKTLYIHDTKIYKFEEGNYIELGGSPNWGSF